MLWASQLASLLLRRYLKSFCTSLPVLGEHVGLMKGNISEYIILSYIFDRVGRTFMDRYFSCIIILMSRYEHS